MEGHDVKKEILEALDNSLMHLNNIPVKDIRDCRRKTAICDDLLAVRKILSALEFKEKEDAHEDTHSEG